MQGSRQAVREEVDRSLRTKGQGEFKVSPHFSGPGAGASVRCYIAKLEVANTRNGVDAYRGCDISFHDKEIVHF